LVFSPFEALARQRPADPARQMGIRHWRDAPAGSTVDSSITGRWSTKIAF